MCLRSIQAARFVHCNFLSSSQSHSQVQSSFFKMSCPFSLLPLSFNDVPCPPPFSNTGPFDSSSRALGGSFPLDTSHQYQLRRHDFPGTLWHHLHVHTFSHQLQSQLHLWHSYSHCAHQSTADFRENFAAFNQPIFTQARFKRIPVTTSSSTGNHP